MTDHLDDTYARRVREIAASLLRLLPPGDFAMRLPDGSTLGAGAEAAFTLVLKRPDALRRMLFPPSELAMGESYLFDDYDIEGDIVAAFRFLDETTLRRPSWRQLLRVLRQLWQLERRAPPAAGRAPGAGDYEPYEAQGKLHSPTRDRQAVQFHYDTSNDFYKLWLDEKMVYSCAYFPTGDETLDEAQEQKLDLLCRKLGLQSGERLLDVGCGWGGLVIHAAIRYGARATGITLSEAQAEEASARIGARGLADRCRVFVRHYEEMAADVPFDKAVSIGMFEHVGKERLVDYMRSVRNLLAPDGLFLLQGGISRVDRRHAGKRWMERLGRGRGAFMQKYSFPDASILNVPTVVATAEQARFEVLEVTNMRRHYVPTLRAWLSRLEANREAAVAMTGEAAYRCWRLILAGYAHLLETGRLSEYQFLLLKRGR